MALRYTGRAVLYLEAGGRAYKNGDTVPISQTDALKMAARSHLHTFEELPEPAAADKPAPKADPKP